MDEQELRTKLDELRAEGIDHLYCGHCGDIEGVQSVDFKPIVRYLCTICRNKILAWI